VEVVGEVLRGAGVVRAVDDRDGRGRERRVRVVGGDGRVVPRRDVAAEDLGERLRRELEVVDADVREVVDDRDRRDVDGQLDDLATLAARGGLGQLLLLERGVGAGEEHATRDELLAATAGPLRVVADGDALVLLGEPGDPALLGLRLRGRTSARQVAGQVGGGRARVGRGLAGAGRGRVGAGVRGGVTAPGHATATRGEHKSKAGGRESVGAAADRLLQDRCPFTSSRHDAAARAMT